MSSGFVLSLIMLVFLVSILYFMLEGLPHRSFDELWLRAGLPSEQRPFK